MEACWQDRQLRRGSQGDGMTSLSKNLGQSYEAKTDFFRPLLTSN